MTTNELVSAAIFVVFVGLLVWGATSTSMRSLRYARRNLRQPILLKRDRDLLLGLAVPFVIIGAVRAFGLQELILDENGQVRLWYLLVTGLPPIYALSRYVYFEHRVIERPPKPSLAERQTEAVERTAAATERIADEQ